MKEGRKPEYTEKTPGDKLQKIYSAVCVFSQQHNSRLDEVDLSSNGMTGTSIAYISDSFQQNIFITKLVCSGG